MKDRQKPKAKRMTRKEIQGAKEQRAIDLAATVASIPEYVPKTAKESQEERDRYQNALVAIGKEIERLATVKTLNKLYQT